MEPISFQYSNPIPTKQAQVLGCYTLLSIRKSHYEHLSIEGKSLLRSDWAANVGDGKEQRFVGTENYPVGDMGSLAMPESLPERVKLVSYLIDLLFIHDDSTETAGLEMANMLHQRLKRVFEAALEQKETTGDMAFLSKHLATVTEYSAPLARQLFRLWIDFLETGDVLESSAGFSSIEEYFPFRIVNGAIPVFWAIYRWGSGLHITDEELASSPLKEIDEAAAHIMIITNDYYSWMKEYDQLCTNGGSGRIMSSVEIIMRTEGLGLEDALSKVGHLIPVYEKRFFELQKKVLDDKNVRDDVKKYVILSGYLNGGSAIWHATCPRYNKWKIGREDLMLLALTRSKARNT